MKRNSCYSSLVIQLAVLVTLALSAFSQTSRVLHFPKERSLGEIWIQSEKQARRHETFHEGPFDNHWTYLGLARGDVVVPAGMKARLNVSTASARDLSPLGQLRPDDLYGLSLWGENVNDYTLSWVAHCKGLKVLHMNGTQVGDDGLRKITGLQSLEYLSLPDRTTDAGLACVATNLTGLKGLFFANTRVRNAGLRHLANLHSLEALDLGGAFINDDGLAHLAGLSKLEHLLLFGRNFTGRGFVHLKKAPSLRVINSFRMATVQDAGLEHLAALPRLESLSLFDNGSISDAGMALLGRSLSLRRLDINQTQVTEAGVKALLQIPSWEHFSLPQGSVSDELLVQLGRQVNLRFLALGSPRPRQPYTAKGLAELSRLKQLEELHLAGTGVTDAAMEQVARLNSLKSLLLLSCPISNAGLAKLATMQLLERIDLKATKSVTPAGLSRLNALPRLTHVHASQIADDSTRLDLSKLTELQSLIIHMRNGALGDDSLATLKGLHHLETMQLPSTGISDAGLGSLRGLTNLAVLIIGGARVTDQGLEQLSELKALSTLRLTGNLSDAGLRSLEKLERLTSVHLRSPQTISPGAVYRLKQALPCQPQISTGKDGRWR